MLPSISLDVRRQPVESTISPKYETDLNRLSISLPTNWIRTVKNHGRDVPGGASGVIREALVMWAIEHDVVLNTDH